MALDANDILRASGPDGLRSTFDETFGAKKKTNGAGKSGHTTRLNVLSATALDAMTFPPINYVVPGIVAEGVTLLAGKGKIGKSYMALDFALAVAAGGVALGSLEVEQGDVLGLFLEDPLWRLQKRQRQLWGDEPLPERLSFVVECPPLDKGGAEGIREWCKSVLRPRLIVIDVLEKVRPRRGNHEQLYEADYRAISLLKEIANEFNVAIFVIHHTSKRTDLADPFDAISGTTGLSGAVDTAIVLTNTPNGPQLYGRGRDIEEFELAARFDKTTGRWTLLGEASDVQRSTERTAILDVLKHARDLLSPSHIAAAVGRTENAVSLALRRMGIAGDVVNEGRGRWRHALRTDLSPPRKNGKKERFGEDDA